MARASQTSRRHDPAPKGGLSGARRESAKSTGPGRAQPGGTSAAATQTNTRAAGAPVRKAPR